MIKSEIGRRDALHAIGRGGMGLLLLPGVLVAGDRHEENKEREEVAPAEDLMREHGLLNRILLVYEEAGRRLTLPKPDLKIERLKDAADIVRHFIEEYHEKLEEDHLFPRFQKAGTLVDLVRLLKEQHEAGRRVTAEILQLATDASMKNPDARRRIINAMHQFIRMYRPHEAREDTVLFPALHEIVSPHEYGALGEDFEKKELELFGEKGYEKMVDKVAGIEQALGIYDLARFSPGL
jgi:hemerythrin-like domain-containing protein